MKAKTINLTKKDLVLEVQKKTGLPISYLSKVIDDMLVILKDSINDGNLNIKNFGTFRLKNKKERIGRNPKTNKIYTIKARRSVSFMSSNLLKKKTDK